MRLWPLIVLLAFPAPAQERAEFYGTWGTTAQCARAPLKPGGTVLARPYEIGPEWLRQGALWCRLRWFPLEPDVDGAFTGAFAACGEDAVRNYRLGMRLSDNRLTLRWDLLNRTGPLTRCRPE